MPGMGAVLSETSSFLPLCSALLEGCSLSFIFPFVTSLVFPLSTLSAFCAYFSPWLDFGVHISFALFSSLSFCLSLHCLISLSPFIHQSVVATSQSSTGAVSKSPPTPTSHITAPNTISTRDRGLQAICGSNLSQLSPPPTQPHYTRPLLLVATAVKAETDTAGEGL